MGSALARRPNSYATEVADQLVNEYQAGKSLPQIASAFGIPVSTVRARILAAGASLRPAVDAMKKAKQEGRGISPLAGKYVRTPEIIEKISKTRIANANATAKGVSLKPSGYLEITRGEDKGRREHDRVFEEAIGAHIPDGFVVHHMDENKTNNSLDNLALMTNAAHARLHALKNLPNRKRDALGRLV